MIYKTSSNKTWLNANKAIELGFADGVLEDIKKQARPPGPAQNYPASL